jgi:hypothetical protein
MTGYDENVYTNCCSQLLGHHDIQSIIAAEAVEDGALLPIREVLCIRCGMSLKQIREQKIKRQKRKKEEAFSAVPEA